MEGERRAQMGLASYLSGFILPNRQQQAKASLHPGLSQPLKRDFFLKR